MAEHVAEGSTTPVEPQPGIEPLPDHHTVNGDSPFGGPSFVDHVGGPEVEHHDPFTSHPEDLAGAEGATREPKPRQQKKAGSRTWLLVLGALFHLTAIGLLVAWMTGAFNRPAATQQEQPEPEKKKKKTRASALGDAPVNWAAVGLRGCDRPPPA
jgi:hypothetical protein